MKRSLNNKGVTLVELIVSFALVAVATIYFYQTLYTVKKLYGESQKETNNFVDVDYAYRIIDELHNQCVKDEKEGNGKCNKDKLSEQINNYMDKDDNFLVTEDSLNYDKYDNKPFSEISFEINGKNYNMHFYSKSVEIHLHEYIEEIYKNEINTDNNTNGSDLEDKIIKESNIDISQLEPFIVEGGTNKQVWCLSTNEDAYKILQCSTGALSNDWCTFLKSMGNLQRNISQVAGGNRKDKYYVIKINGSYKMITTDDDIRFKES